MIAYDAMYCYMFSLATQFGATRCISPDEYKRPIEEVLRDLTDGGLDYTFECIGNVSTMV